MRRNHADDRPGTDRGGNRNGTDRTDQNGSSHDTACANTGPGKTATFSSARQEINPADPVPLYLVPPVLAREIRRLGGQITEMHVMLGASHQYAITLVTRGGAE